MTRHFLSVLLLVGVSLLVVLGSGIAAAAVTTSSSTTYNGSEAGTDQAIEVRYTVSPDQSTVNNMTVNFDGTEQTFIEPNSFSFTVNPGEANINVQSRSGNRFFLREMEPDEEVTFVFEVYPKTIKEEQVDAVNVRMDYIQNGQELTDSETVTADASSSPWFSLQSAQETIEDQESQLEGVSLVGQVTDVAFLGGVIVGVAGLGIGVYSWRRRSSDLEDLKRDHAEDLESLAERMKKDTDGKKVRNEAEKIREELDDPDGGPW